MANILRKHTRDWHILHTISKPVIRKILKYVADSYKPIINKKKEKGFVNPEMQVFYDEWTELIDMQMDQWTGPEDKNYKMYHALRDIMCCILDEDSHYLLRFFYLIEMIHRDREKYRISMHRSRAYWHNEEEKKKIHDIMNWPAVFKAVKGKAMKKGYKWTGGLS